MRGRVDVPPPETTGRLSFLSIPLPPHALLVFLKSFQLFPDLPHLCFRFFQRTRIIDDEIGVIPLFLDGQLGIQHLNGHLSRDVIALHQALDLLFWGDVNEKDLVEEILEVRFDEQRDGHLDDDLRIFRGVFLHQPAEFFVNPGMDEPLQLVF